MQRSSTNIGTLAAALAKAQAEIANPEKSLTATIVSPFPREGTRTFRYAPLASGLDLVRKCLGQHEIATVQATAIDGEGGLIRLTTTLVHASGEWVSSDWPVCSISEAVAPHRLGAALTYARRYALFTLVGIAGEDDLDAPDLPTTNQNLPASTTPNEPKASRGTDLHVVRRPARLKQSHPPPLAFSASRNLRQRLIAELEELNSSAALADWAYRALPLKHQLVVTDAQAVDDAFMATATRIPENVVCSEVSDLSGPPSTNVGTGERQVVVISNPARERDRDHLKFVA